MLQKRKEVRTVEVLAEPLPFPRSWEGIHSVCSWCRKEPPGTTAAFSVPARISSDSHGELFPFLLACMFSGEHTKLGWLPGGMSPSLPPPPFFPTSHRVNLREISVCWERGHIFFPFAGLPLTPRLMTHTHYCTVSKYSEEQDLFCRPQRCQIISCRVCCFNNEVTIPQCGIIQFLEF